MNRKQSPWPAAAALLGVLLVGMALTPVMAHAAEPGAAARCTAVRNDDALLPYDATLRAGLARAFARLFPGVQRPPPDAELQTASIRCMNGRLLACFTGANLPCGKMNPARESHGASEYCRGHLDAPVVPAFATGHDTIYAYRCAAGRPVVAGRTFELDARGFAAKLWAPLD